MSDDGISVGQISQLHEIETASRRLGLPGLMQPFQDFIRVQHARIRDPRVRVASQIWRCGWGSAQSAYASLAEYLESVPTIPALPKGKQASIWQSFLVDPRISDVNACFFVGLTHHDLPSPIPTFGPKRPDQPYWFFCDPRKVGVIDGHGRDVRWRSHECGITLLEMCAMIAEIGPPEKEVICLGSISREGNRRSVPVITGHGTIVHMLSLQDAVLNPQALVPVCIVPNNPE